MAAFWRSAAISPTRWFPISDSGARWWCRPFLSPSSASSIERVLIRRLYGRDPLYSLLLTFGLAFMIEDGTRFIWGAQSLPYSDPELAVERR